MNSSDNSEDSSEGTPNGHDGPNVEAEKMLPSVVCLLRLACLV